MITALIIYIIGFFTIPIITVLLNVYYFKEDIEEELLKIIATSSFAWPIMIIILFYCILMTFNDRNYRI